MPYKKISDSEVVLTELMIPSYANFGGKVHGGVILSLMDKVAYVCATKHAEMSKLSSILILHIIDILSNSKVYHEENHCSAFCLPDDRYNCTF